MKYSARFQFRQKPVLYTLYIALLFSTLLPSQTFEIFLVVEDEGSYVANKHWNGHTDEAVEQEAGVSSITGEEDYDTTWDEAKQCSLTTDAGEENTHEEESAQTAGQQSEDFLEEVEQWENFPCSH